MTVQEAYEVLREALTDDVMKSERLRVYQMVMRKTRDLLLALGVPDLLDTPLIEEKLALFQEYHHVPGHHLWQAMQFVFRVARDGGDEQDAELKNEYLQLIYRTLFTSPLQKLPRIPDNWWATPLGLACKVVDKGIESCMELIEQLAQEG